MINNINVMFTENEKEKISRAEKRKNGKLTKYELELILDRDLSDREWWEYEDMPYIKDVIIVDEPLEEPIAPVEEPEDVVIDGTITRIDYSDYTIIKKTAANGKMENIQHILKTDYAEYSVAYEISNETKDFIRRHKIIKFSMIIYVESKNPHTEEIFIHPFRSKTEILNNSHIDEMDEIIASRIAQLQSNYRETTTDKSGLVFLRLSRIDINMVSTEPNTANSYIELPKWISDKKATINVKNNDNKCFKWAVLAALHHSENTHINNVYTYTKYENELNFNDIRFPVAISDIEKFEKNNENIAVNVYGEEKEVISSLYISYKYNESNILPENVKLVNLLYYIKREVDDNENIISENSHYVTITKFNTLVFKQGNKSHKNVMEYAQDVVINHIRKINIERI